MSIFSRMRSVLGTVLKTVLIDPDVIAAQTRIVESNERFKDPIENAAYKSMTSADVKEVIRERAYSVLQDYLDDHPDMDSAEWEDWRDQYDAV